VVAGLFMVLLKGGGRVSLVISAFFLFSSVFFFALKIFEGLSGKRVQLKFLFQKFKLLQFVFTPQTKLKPGTDHGKKKRI